MTASVGDRLRKLVAAKGWTLQQFADELGVVYETVRKWLTGETRPTHARATKVAKLLDTTPEFILYGSTPAVNGAARPSALQAAEPKALYGKPTLRQALPVVLDAIAAAKERDKLRAALLAFLDDDAQAYRQRLAELLGEAADLGNSRAA
jgi:transcriptional regulator with XRE-family HTH domain